MGSLKYHRIQQRGAAKTKMLIEEVKSGETQKDRPKFRIIREPLKGDPEILTVQVHIKDLVSCGSFYVNV